MTTKTFFLTMGVEEITKKLIEILDQNRILDEFKISGSYTDGESFFKRISYHPLLIYRSFQQVVVLELCHVFFISNFAVNLFKKIGLSKQHCLKKVTIHLKPRRYIVSQDREFKAFSIAAYLSPVSLYYSSNFFTDIKYSHFIKILKSKGSADEKENLTNMRQVYDLSPTITKYRFSQAYKNKQIDQILPEFQEYFIPIEKYLNSLK